MRPALTTYSLGLAVSVASAKAAGLCESERARVNAERIAEEWPLRSSGDALSRYAQSLVQRLARSSHRERVAWRVDMVRERREHRVGWQVMDCRLCFSNFLAVSRMGGPIATHTHAIELRNSYTCRYMNWRAAGTIVPALFYSAKTRPAR